MHNHFSCFNVWAHYWSNVIPFVHVSVLLSLCLYRSFFQSLCVLGYCILPLTVAMIVCRIVLLGGSGIIGFAVRLIVVTASFSWSTFGKNQSKSFIYFQQSQKTKGPEIVLLKLFRFLLIVVMFRIHVWQTSSSGSACSHHQGAV